MSAMTSWENCRPEIGRALTKINRKKGKTKTRPAYEREAAAATDVDTKLDNFAHRRAAPATPAASKCAGQPSLEERIMMSELRPQTVRPSFPPQALRVPSAISPTWPMAEGTQHRAVSDHQADRCLQRVAALLITISRNNAYEGRDPDIIPDSVTSGFVADLLGSSVSTLAHSLIELQHLGLIAQDQGGALRLLDRPALESLIDVH